MKIISRTMFLVAMAMVTLVVVLVVVCAIVVAILRATARAVARCVYNLWILLLWAWVDVWDDDL